MPGMTGMAQEATGLGDFSTCTTRRGHVSGSGAGVEWGGAFPQPQRRGPRRLAARELTHLHEAHAAVAGDGEAVVVAEPRNLHAAHLAGLLG